MASYEKPSGLDGEFLPASVCQDSRSIGEVRMSSYCTNCGGKLPAGAKFCAECGTSIVGAAAPIQLIVPVPSTSLHHEPICGVCGRPGTKKTTSDGEFGPLSRKPGEPPFHYLCWVRYRNGSAPVQFVFSTVQSLSPSDPAYIAKSYRNMWWITICVVVALFAICVFLIFTSSITLRPST